MKRTRVKCMLADFKLFERVEDGAFQWPCSLCCLIWKKTGDGVGAIAKLKGFYILDYSRSSSFPRLLPFQDSHYVW